MKIASLWRIAIALIVVIIIIGGVILIIILGPIREPQCIKCITDRVMPWVIVEMVAAIASIPVINQIKNISQRS
jgi:hypothetical protein